LPLRVEVHSAPKWVEGLKAPSVDELFAATVPSRAGVPGVDTLLPEQHALVLTAHSWAHEPLRRVLELVDVAAITEGLDRGELRRLAKAWGLARVWNVTIGVTDALLDNGGLRGPLPLRLWARNLPDVRGRTVLETHVERLIAAFWALPTRKALRSAVASIGSALGPAQGESWQNKLARTRLAFRHASAPRSQHEASLKERGRR
jgi:hypothetical protein